MKPYFSPDSETVVGHGTLAIVWLVETRHALSLRHYRRCYRRHYLWLNQMVYPKSEYHEYVLALQLMNPNQHCQHDF